MHSASCTDSLPKARATGRAGILREPLSLLKKKKNTMACFCFVCFLLRGLYCLHSLTSLDVEETQKHEQRPRTGWMSFIALPGLLASKLGGNGKPHGTHVPLSRSKEGSPAPSSPPRVEDMLFLPYLKTHFFL